jgi:hypothetical protein
VRRVAAVACCLLLSAGCAANIEVGPPPGQPTCADLGRQESDVLVLVAQSVPTASWLPCVRSLPVGWNFQHLDVQRGRTLIRLGATDREGDHVVTVRLTADCDVGGAVKATGEQPALQRYEHVARSAPGYLADWYYRFAGGCVTYHFDLKGRAGAEAASAVSAGLGFVSRDAVAAVVSERSDGRLTLDPGGA